MQNKRRIELLGKRRCFITGLAGKRLPALRCRNQLLDGGGGHAADAKARERAVDLAGHCAAFDQLAQHHGLFTQQPTAGLALHRLGDQHIIRPVNIAARPGFADCHSATRQHGRDTGVVAVFNGAIAETARIGLAQIGWRVQRGRLEIDRVVVSNGLDLVDRRQPIDVERRGHALA